jgi:hypothetical protein
MRKLSDDDNSDVDSKDVDLIKSYDSKNSELMLNELDSESTITTTVI